MKFHGEKDVVMNRTQCNSGCVWYPVTVLFVQCQLFRCVYSPVYLVICWFDDCCFVFSLENLIKFRKLSLVYMFANVKNIHTANVFKVLFCFNCLLVVVFVMEVLTWLIGSLQKNHGSPADATIRLERVLPALLPAECYSIQGITFPSQRFSFPTLF